MGTELMKAGACRTEMPKGKGKKPINKDRFVSKMCTSTLAHDPAARADVHPLAVLRGDSVVLGTIVAVMVTGGRQLTLLVHLQSSATRKRSRLGRKRPKGSWSDEMLNRCFYVALQSQLGALT